MTNIHIYVVLCSTSHVPVLMGSQNISLLRNEFKTTSNNLLKQEVLGSIPTLLPESSSSFQSWRNERAPGSKRLMTMYSPLESSSSSTLGASGSSSSVSMESSISVRDFPLYWWYALLPSLLESLTRGQREGPRRFYDSAVSVFSPSGPSPPPSISDPRHSGWSETTTQ